MNNLSRIVVNNRIKSLTKQINDLNKLLFIMNDYNINEFSFSKKEDPLYKIIDCSWKSMIYDSRDNHPINVVNMINGIPVFFYIKDFEKEMIKDEYKNICFNLKIKDLGLKKILRHLFDMKLECEAFVRINEFSEFINKPLLAEYIMVFNKELLQHQRKLSIRRNCD